MSRRPPDTKTVLVYLVIGLLLVAIASILLGSGGWLRVVRLVVLYGAAFLLLMYVFRRMRR